MAQATSYQQLKSRALALLARRDHSVFELKRKLTQKLQTSPAQLNQLINELSESNLLNDERFCENYVDYRRSRGFGLNKIQMELREKGISTTTITEVIQQQDSFLEDAKRVRARKFGEELPKQPQDKARQIRFLMSRGFPIRVIELVFK